MHRRFSFAQPLLSCAVQVARLYGGPLLVQKGKYDSISDGQRTIVCREEGSPRRAGGQARHQHKALKNFQYKALNASQHKAL